MRKFDINCHIHALQVQPGDVVVLTIEQLLTAEQTMELRSALTRQLEKAGLKNQLIILTHDARLYTLSASEIQGMADK